MTQSKTERFKIDVNGTKKIRQKMRESKKIKITINIDQDVLEHLRGTSDETGVPYQTLLNRVLREALEKGNQSEERMDRLEKEIDFLKKKISA